MAAGTIVTAWKDATTAYAAVRVAEGGTLGTVEYIGSTPLIAADGSTKAAATLKADLLAAVSAVRAAMTAGVTPLAGVSGSVTV